MPLVEALIIKGGIALWKMAKIKVIATKLAYKFGAKIAGTAMTQGVAPAISTAASGLVVVGGVALSVNIVECVVDFIAAVKAKDNLKAVVKLADLYSHVGFVTSEVKEAVSGVIASKGISGGALAIAAVNELSGEAMAMARKKVIGY